MSLFKWFKTDPIDEFSSDEIQLAALRIIGNNFHCSLSWIGGRIERCNDVDAKIKAAREQYASFEPRRIRHAIMD